MTDNLSPLQPLGLPNEAMSQDQLQMHKAMHHKKEMHHQMEHSKNLESHSRSFHRKVKEKRSQKNESDESEVPHEEYEDIYTLAGQGYKMKPSSTLERKPPPDMGEGGQSYHGKKDKKLKTPMSLFEKPK